MVDCSFKKSLPVFVFLLQIVLLKAQPWPADLFDLPEKWSVVAGDAVDVSARGVAGEQGRCLEVAIDFTAGSGYGGVRAVVPQQLPENFKFTFYMKSDLPDNNLEFKLVDDSGDNVWWYIERAMDLPDDWQKITVKKRNIEFAWGPIGDRTLRRFHALEFIISSVNGGRGHLWLDRLTFEPLDPPDAHPPKPVLSAASSLDADHQPGMADDDNKSTSWHSDGRSDQYLLIDCTKYREFGALVIDWDDRDFALQYDVLVSDDLKDWRTAYRVTGGGGGRRYLNLRNFDARYIKLVLRRSSHNQGYGISEIGLLDYDFVRRPETLFTKIAADQPRGLYPRYLLGEQSYWTITGAVDDDNEALINEDGAVEVDRRSFSIEPFVFMDDSLWTWDNSETSQALEENYLPVPSVTRRMSGVRLETKIFAAGEDDGSTLFLLYSLKNERRSTVSGHLYLALRPFQVNPPWQVLTNPGGMARVRSIENQQEVVRINGDKLVVPLQPAAAFGAVNFDAGPVINFIKKDRLPDGQNVNDLSGFASAAWRYDFTLAAGAGQRVVLAVPWQAERNIAGLEQSDVDAKLAAVLNYWRGKLNGVTFDLPAGAERLVNTIRTNLAYILINRDGRAIHPGSRSYERSWIRDGSLTSSALLKLNIQSEPRQFIEWFAGHQYDNGKVPCVVDKRGPDPVPENDSHGQLIFAIMQYYQFTHDKYFLERNFHHVIGAVRYMEELSALRRTDRYLTGSATEQACYGLLPASISHEGYSAKPMHSYWDDFFAMKGYKDAVDMARILGRDSLAAEWSARRDRFKKDLYRSIERAMKNKGISFIPGCVELGDFDATSTAIAIYPCNELPNLPQPAAHNTFDRYFDYFSKRRDGALEWNDYTPYEVRLIGTFLYLGQKDRAHQLMDFFFSDQRPPAWNHWAEVVRPDYRTPGFIGDMPHTWVASDFISAARAMFVYEDELNSRLVVGAGWRDEWVDSAKGMAVHGLPTYHGRLSYSVSRTEHGYAVDLKGDLELPENGLVISNIRQQRPLGVRLNGRELTDYDQKEIRIHEFPARVEIEYE